MKKTDKTKDSDEIAEVYNKFGKMYHESRKNSGRLFNEFLEMPATEALLPEHLENRVVLDAGCGSGIYAQKLAKRGARVIGVDISETMISIAKAEKDVDDEIDYRIGDLAQLDLKDNSVDLIICNYVLENLADIKSVFVEFYRVLNKGGEFIYSISHPIRAMAKRNVNDNYESWILDNYYDRTTRISDFGNGMKIKKYKRTISDYLNASIAAGFIINACNEPQPIPAGEQNDPTSYNLAMRLPQLLVIKMIKQM